MEAPVQSVQYDFLEGRERGEGERGRREGGGGNVGIVTLGVSVV